MLYHLRELQRSVLQPMTASAEAATRLYTNPYSPLAWTPGAQRLAAGFELMRRVGKDYEKPAFGLRTTTVDGHEVHVVERVVAVKPFCNLVKFERLFPEKRAADPAILLFAPLSGHYATLLRDTVRAMLPDHDVYITDWVNAREVPAAEGRFGFDEFVGYCVDFMRLLGPEVHVVAVCQPTVPVLAAVALMSTLKDARVPRSVTLMGGPIDPRENPTTVNALAEGRDLAWFEKHLLATVPPTYAGSGRRVYPGFMQHTAFVSMNPERHATSHWDYFRDLVKGDQDSAEAHRAFYDEYNAVLDMDADFYLDTVRMVFQEHALPRGVMHVNFEGERRRVATEDITTPSLFTIEGELDDIAGVGQSEAALELCPNVPDAKKHKFVAPGAGHYGIFSGRRWRETIYPKLKDFIRSA